MKKLIVLVLKVCFLSILCGETFGNWDVTIDIDPIDDSKKISAINLSIDDADPAFLIIRSHKNQNEVFISFDDYLGDNDEIIVRFDKEEAIRQRWLPSVDSTALFYSGTTNSFLKKLTQTNQLVVRTFPYRDSPITAIFDLVGLQEIVETYPEAFALQENQYKHGSDGYGIYEDQGTVTLEWQLNQDVVFYLTIPNGEGRFFLELKDSKALRRGIEFLAIDTANGRWLYRLDNDYPAPFLPDSQETGYAVLENVKDNASFGSGLSYRTELPNAYVDDLCTEDVVIQIRLSDGTYFRIADNTAFIELLTLFCSYLDPSQLL